MTPNTQRESLAVLAEVWAMSPEVRLGQLLAHLGFLGEAYLGRGLGEIDDDELLAILYRHRSELESRSSGTPDVIPRPQGAQHRCPAVQRSWSRRQPSGLASSRGRGHLMLQGGRLAPGRLPSFRVENKGRADLGDRAD